MKSNLIIKLIAAHSSGSNSQFEKALSELVQDEERKGNSALALSLRNAYAPEKRHINDTMSSPMSTMSFATQSISGLPKDKDTTLDLIEVLESKIKLRDVALSSKAYDTIMQIVEEQKKVDKLIKSGIIPTNRVLLCGPPGCGKTMTAHALAGELNLPIVYVRLDGLISSYLGQTGTNIRKVFEFVKGKQVMLFLDEFDAIAKKRDDSHELGELKRVVTTLLQNLDEMSANVFLVAATNHQHLLDPAIWRRFEISILLEEPNDFQREKIICNAISKYLKEYEVDSKKLVVLTEGMNGAQIETFLKSLAKQCVMKKEVGDKVTIEEIGKVWLKHAAIYISEDSDDFISALSKLRASGVSIRSIEAITGIPKSTLSYRFNKGEKINDK